MVTRLLEPSEEDRKFPKKLSSSVPDDHIQLGDRTWLVAGKTTAEEMSDQLGISDGKSGSGYVFEIDRYFGFATKNVWDWIRVKWEEHDRG